MGTYRAPNGDVFELKVDMIEVTSNHRPDPTWLFVDEQGHIHRWYVGGVPALGYFPTQTFDTPTLIWVKDGTRVDEDGETHDIGHLECRECGQHIDPRYTADQVRQFRPGMKCGYINGQSVSFEEFQRRAREWGLVK